jgi:MFS family permease
VNIFAFIIEGILQINNIYVLLVCRAFQGLFVGYYMSIVPIYINELAPKQIVGSFGVFAQLFVVFGVIISYGIGLIMQKTNVNAFVFYRIMVSINAVLIIAQSILLLVGYIPESPNSLIRKNRNEEAMQVIAMFTVASHV